MSKLRSDSVFCQLSNEQIEQVEDWLFEDKLSYKEAQERIQKEFGITGSLSGLGRFYRRLAQERTQLSLVETVKACVEASKTVEPVGVLQTGLLTLAYKCAVEFLQEHPGEMKQFTALLRALTSAEGMMMKRVQFEREEERLREEKIKEEKKRVAEAERSARELERWKEECRVKEERKRARLAEKSKAAEAAKAGEGEGNCPAGCRTEQAGSLFHPDNGEATKATAEAAAETKQPNPLIPSCSPSGGEGVGGAGSKSMALVAGADGTWQPVVLAGQNEANQPVKPLNAA